MINIQHLVYRISEVMDVDAFASVTAETDKLYTPSRHMPSWTRVPFMSQLHQDLCNKLLVLIEPTYMREFESRCVANRKRFRRLLRMTCRQVDIVIATSEAQHTWLVESGLLARAGVTTMSPAVDWVKLGTVAPPMNGETPLRLAASGTLNYRNDFDVLMEVMRRLPGGLATLEFASIGEERGALCKAARGIKGVCLTPQSIDPLSLLARNNAVTVPPRWQTAAVQVNQACAGARPLLVTNVDADAQVGSTTWAEKVPPDEPEDIAEAGIRRAGRSLSELGDAARATAVATRQNSQQKWSRVLRTAAL